MLFNNIDYLGRQKRRIVLIDELPLSETSQERTLRTFRACLLRVLRAPATACSPAVVLIFSTRRSGSSGGGGRGRNAAHSQVRVCVIFRSII